MKNEKEIKFITRDKKSVKSAHKIIVNFKNDIKLNKIGHRFRKKSKILGLRELWWDSHH